MKRNNLLGRRNFLSSVAVFSGISLSGCTGISGGLQIVDEEYHPYTSRGYGVWIPEIKNSGETTNVVGIVDIVSTDGEDEGNILKTFDETEVVQKGETKELRMKHGHYLNPRLYEFSRRVEPTDRPHATFEASKSGENSIKLDASKSKSIVSNISSYEWAVAEWEYFKVRDPFPWKIPKKEVVEFTPPVGDDASIFGKFVLRVTDEEGRTDMDYGGSLTINNRVGYDREFEVDS